MKLYNLDCLSSNYISLPPIWLLLFARSAVRTQWTRPKLDWNTTDTSDDDNQNHDVDRKAIFNDGIIINAAIKCSNSSLSYQRFAKPEPAQFGEQQETMCDFSSLR